MPTDRENNRTNDRPSPKLKPLLAAILIGLAGISCATAGSLSDLGLIAPGANSYAYGASLDGSVVAGQVHVVGGGDFGFFRTPDGTMNPIALPVTPPTIGGFAATDLYINGVSANGKVAFGDLEAPGSTFDTMAFRWTTAGGLQTLGQLAGGSHSSANAASADGNVIVGSALDAQSTIRAFRWTEGGGMQSLGTLGGYVGSLATGVNADGNVVVGYGTNGGNTAMAFRWTTAGGMQSLGLPATGGWAQSIASAVNSDGDVVVGYVNNAGGNGSQAFRWSTAGGYRVLGTLNAGTTSYAVAVSGNGAVVVGGAKDGAAGNADRAFRWSEASGMQTVEAWAGVTPASPTVYAYGTNYDGSVVVGTLQNGHAFIATGAGVLALDSVQTTSLGGAAQASVAAVNVTGLVFSGAHGNPLANRPLPGKNNCVWALGDLGQRERDGYDANIGIGEVGGCQVISADQQITAAIGHTRARQDGPLTSRFEFDGTYGTVGVLSRLGGSLWSAAELLYQSGSADIRRGYLNGGSPDASTGNTGISTTGVRIRLIGDQSAQLGSLSLSPYLEASWLESRTDAYAESGGSFAASFNDSKEKATTARLGVHAGVPLGKATRLLAQAEAAHRFEKHNANTSGSIAGVFSFDIPGAELQRNWQRVGLGVEHQVGSGMVTLFGNVTTEGGDPDSWATLSYRSSF